MCFSRFPANESHQKNRLAFLSFGKNPVFTSLHLKTPIYVVPPLDFAEREKCKPVHLRLSLAGNLENKLCSSMGPNEASTTIFLYISHCKIKLELRKGSRLYSTYRKYRFSDNRIFPVLVDFICGHIYTLLCVLQSYQHRGEKGRGEIGAFYLPSKLEHKPQLCS